MGRRLALTAILVAGVAIAGALADTHATIVTTDGARHDGILVYRHDNNMSLIIGGKERVFPQSEIAAILFDTGNPSESELNALPVGDNPPELERNLIVLRNGERIQGKLHDIKEDGSVTFDTRSGRRDLSIGEIARLYLRAARARSLMASAPAVAATTGQTASPAVTPPAGSFRVGASQPWTDTDIIVRRGDRVSFKATGEIRWASGGDATAGPDGNLAITNRTGYPVTAMPVAG